MSDELLIDVKPKQDNSCIALTAIAGCPGIMSDEGIVKEFLSQAKAAAARGADLRETGALRDIIENPETKAAQYRALMYAGKFRFLKELFLYLAQNFEVSAVGCYQQAHGSAEYKPLIAAPANEFGEYVRSQLVQTYEGLGVVPPGSMKKMELKEGEVLPGTTATPGTNHS